MILCVDVDYGDSSVRAAGVGLSQWESSMPEFELVRTHHVAPAPYQPGEFYKRELPHLLSLIAEAPASLEVVVVDGYVWLGREQPGLGARLHQALDGRLPVVGVAKNPFVHSPAELVYRGESRKPLFVTAIGLDVETASRAVQRMHGENRLPTMLKRVDQLTRRIDPRTGMLGA